MARKVTCSVPRRAPVRLESIEYCREGRDLMEVLLLRGKQPWIVGRRPTQGARSQVRWRCRCLAWLGVSRVLPALFGNPHKKPAPDRGRKLDTSGPLTRPDQQRSRPVPRGRRITTRNRVWRLPGRKVSPPSPAEAGRFARGRALGQTIRLNLFTEVVLPSCLATRNPD